MPHWLMLCRENAIKELNEVCTGVGEGLETPSFDCLLHSTFTPFREKIAKSDGLILFFLMGGPK